VPHSNLLNAVSVAPIVIPLDPSFDPNTGGVPFCSSGSLGTILCYPPSFLKTAYDFPSTTGRHGLDGSGQNVVIVDAFGSPTIQSDLNTFDTTFGLPPTTVNILCGPTWTGAATDNCPVKTVADLSTAPNAALCGAVSWAEETTLDVTMVHSLAPGATIYLVVANDCLDPSITAAETAVVNQHSLRGSIMSQSFGEPDDMVGCTAVDPVTLQCTATDPTIKANADKAYETATFNRWTLIASSGDDGANENARVLGTTELTPAWPATNPLNLAAGGTQGNPYGGQYGTFPGPGGTFTCAAGATCNTGLVVISNPGTTDCTTAPRPGEPSSCIPVGYGGESGWNEYTSFLSFLGVGGAIGRSSGGGISTLYDRPFFQIGLPRSFTTLLGSKVEADGRMTPDVSFNSAAQGGWLAYLGFLGVWGVFSGTSAAAPAWAAIIALLDQQVGDPVGYITPAIYALGWAQTLFRFDGRAAFHDITSGENSDTAGQFGVDGFTASHGYDLVTGWGSPDVSNFLSGVSHFVHP
jgi:subtilase family serine protease